MIYLINYLQFLIMKGQKSAEYTLKDHHNLENVDVEVVHFDENVDALDVTVDSLGYTGSTRFNWGK